MSDHDNGAGDWVLRPPLPTLAASTTDSSLPAAPRVLISALRVGCHVLQLQPETTFAAACLLHRYFYNYYSSSTPPSEDHNVNNKGEKTSRQCMKKKKKDQDEHLLILVSCILLATKSQEDGRRLRDFINLRHMLSWDGDYGDNFYDYSGTCDSNDNNNKGHVAMETTAINDNGQNQKQQPTQQKQEQQQRQHTLYWTQRPPDLDEGYWATKEQVVEMEQYVLRWLAFDVHVSPAHRAVVGLAVQLQQQQQQLQQGQGKQLEQQQGQPSNTSHKKETNDPLTSLDSAHRQLIATAFDLLEEMVPYCPVALTVPLPCLACAILHVAMDHKPLDKIALLLWNDKHVELAREAIARECRKR